MTIKHRLGSYPIHFCSLEEAFEVGENEVVITDSGVTEAFPRLLNSHPLVVNPGEFSKSIAVYGDLLEQLAMRGVGRKGKVIAIGGGVIGDLAGFVAATYLRGVDLIQVPTTLLAQVDSSVGGKVGIDLPQGKNLAGSFYPPSEVRIAIEALARLDAQQFSNGMAEVIKYGFALDEDLLSRLRSRVLPDSPELAALIRRCIQCKAQMVEEDEFETLGLRAKLNFGHTIGHALEAEAGYGHLLHGEAVAVGMRVEVALGEHLGITPLGTGSILDEVCKEQGLKTTHSLLSSPEKLIPWMMRDKKRVSNGLPFSLLTGVGHCKLFPDVAEVDVVQGIRKACEA